VEGLRIIGNGHRAEALDTADVVQAHAALPPLMVISLEAYWLLVSPDIISIVVN